MIRTYGSDNGSKGSAMPGVPEVYLPNDVCYPLQLAAKGFRFPTLLAPRLELLTHESIHARGQANEGVTDCDAVHEMAGVAVRYFNVKTGLELRSLMTSVWQWRDKAAPMYRTVC
jgi:hypothetical protein